MHTFIACIISIIVFCVLIALCISAACWLYDYLERRAAKRERRAATIIAGRINTMHWWFVKNPEVFNALFFTQYMLKKYGYMNADTIRNLVNTFGKKRYCDMPKEELEGWLP